MAFTGIYQDWIIPFEDYVLRCLSGGGRAYAAYLGRYFRYTTYLLFVELSLLMWYTCLTEEQVPVTNYSISIWRMMDDATTFVRTGTETLAIVDDCPAS